MKPTEVLDQNNFEINDSEDDSEELNQGEELGYIEFENNLVDAVVIKDYFSILKKVHTILDCKTCWNSLFDMVEHFAKLSKYIEMLSKCSLQ